MTTLFNDRYECGSFLDGITPLHSNMTITDRLKITISPLRLHAASSVRIPNSTHSFRTLLPTVRIRPLKLFWVSSVNVRCTSNSNIFVIIHKLEYPLLSRQFYVNIQIRSKDLVCILAYLSAMPRVATVVSIYVPILLSLHP